MRGEKEHHIQNGHNVSMPDYYENYKELAIAIVESAVYEYINTDNQATVYAIRKFFQSDYYKVLCDIDPHYMIKICERKRRERING